MCRLQRQVRVASGRVCEFSFKLPDWNEWISFKEGAPSKSQHCDLGNFDFLLEDCATSQWCDKIESKDEAQNVP